MLDIELLGAPVPLDAYLVFIHILVLQERQKSKDKVGVRFFVKLHRSNTDSTSQYYVFKWIELVRIMNHVVS